MLNSVFDSYFKYTLDSGLVSEPGLDLTRTRTQIEQNQDFRDMVLIFSDGCVHMHRNVDIIYFDGDMSDIMPALAAFADMKEKFEAAKIIIKPHIE